MRIRDILLEYDRNLEIKKHESKLLKAIKNDDFFFKKVKNLDDDKKVNVLYDQFESIDPTPNHKYIKWLVQNYIKGKFRIEDAERVREALSEFDKLKPRLKNYGKSPDINQYDLHSLEDMLEELKGGTTKGETEFHKRFKELNPNEYNILYDGPYGILVTPKTKKASCVLGRGTKWCTASTKNQNNFDYYKEKSPLYIWKDNTGIYQFHFETQQFMDARDRPIPPEKLREMRGKSPVLDKFFKNEVRKRLNSDRTSLFKLIQATGSIRDKELESIIKKDPKFAFDYAHNILKGNRFHEAEPYIMKDPAFAYEYAKIMMKNKRWPEAEPYIMKDPYWAYKYAIDVMKNKRWLEAEPYIMKDPKQAYLYAENVIKGRWPEAEPYIMKDPEAAVWYAYKLMNKKRWPEAEPYIKKDPEWASRYIHHVMDNKRWPEAEPYIKKDPSWAYYYAYDVMNKKRWPEAEPYIKKDPEWAYNYAENVIEGRWPEAEPYIMKDPKWATNYAIHVMGRKRWPEAESYIKKDPEWFSTYNYIVMGKKAF